MKLLRKYLTPSKKNEVISSTQRLLYKGNNNKAKIIFFKMKFKITQ